MIGRRKDRIKEFFKIIWLFSFSDAFLSSIRDITGRYAVGDLAKPLILQRKQTLRSNESGFDSPGDRMMKQYKAASKASKKAVDDSGVTYRSESRAQWEKLKGGIYDAVDKIPSTEELQKPSLSAGVVQFDDNQNKASSGNIFTSTYNQVKDTTLNTKKKIQNTVETVQNIPNVVDARVKSVQKSVNETLDIANTVANDIKSIPSNVQTSIKNVQDTVTTTSKNIQETNRKVRVFVGLEEPPPPPPPPPKTLKDELLEIGKDVTVEVLKVSWSATKLFASFAFTGAGKLFELALIKIQEEKLLPENSSFSKMASKISSKKGNLQKLDSEVDEALLLAEEALATVEKEEKRKKEESEKKKKNSPFFLKPFQKL